MADPTPAARIVSKEVDVLVVGGGIVGAGVARDAAMRGLRVMLVEKADFASGTSSRSSRLLHGGLRYLAQGRIGLVREASVEKIILQRIAPHLAQPMPFLFPTRTHSDWPKWKLRIGVKLYDLLCGGHNFGKSSALSREQILSRVPALTPDNLTGGVRYFDGFTNDARLVIDTLRSAAHHGAELFNYASLIDSNKTPTGWICNIRDHVMDETVSITTRAIVNATGAWSNLLPQSRVPLRLTKGVHLVIDRQRLPIDDAIVMADGSRILFAIPWGQRLILGTTDTDFTGDRDRPTADRTDIDYILRVTNSNFPSLNLSVPDITSAWAGLRPLIDAGEPGAPSDISRRHLIQMPQPGWFDVAGGKLTTYRLMAEQTVDCIFSHLKIPPRGCATATTALLSPFSPVACDRWSGRLKNRSQAAGLKEEAHEDLPFSGILPPDVSRAAVEHFCRNEWAQHLSDIMIRRTSWRHYLPDHFTAARQVAEWMSEILDWSAVRQALELSDYRTETELNARV